MHRVFSTLLSQYKVLFLNRWFYLIISHFTKWVVMKKYAWRNSVTATISNREALFRGKLAFKTQDTSWIQTNDPVIVLISVASQFHEGIGGDLKMNALMTTIKNNVKGSITVLLAECAHLQTASLAHNGDKSLALQEATKTAKILAERYKQCFESCNVEYWHSYIRKDKAFADALAYAKSLYKDDLYFIQHVKNSAEASYTLDRMHEYPDKAVYIEMTVNDLLEQCACVLVLASKGYRFQFYPGSPCSCTEYINSLLDKNTQISWIDVFLSIEKKTTVLHQSAA